MGNDRYTEITVKQDEKAPLVDTHVHFNLNCKDPVNDLVNYIEKYALNNVVLIINTEEQLHILQNGMAELGAYWEKIEIVWGLDRTHEFWETGRQICYKYNKKFNLKIHPRLYSIQKQDISWYIKKIEELVPAILVVDDFYYGDTVPEEFGVDLISEVAPMFPQIKIVMAHAGGVNLLRHVMQTKVHPNVFYDISLTCNYLQYSSVMKDMGWLLHFLNHRVMLGSDYPDFTIEEARNSILEIKKDISLSDEMWNNVLSHNFVRVYGG